MIPDKPRIPPLPPETQLKGVPAGKPGIDGQAGPHLNIFLTLGRNPALLDKFNRLGGHLLVRGLVPPREREIVILRVGWRCGSVYEFGQHCVIGQAVGLSAQEIRRLTVPDLAGWSPVDSALVAMADELCLGNQVGTATWDALAESWDEQQLLELLVLAGFYRMVSGFLNSVGVELEPGTPGWPEQP